MVFAGESHDSSNICSTTKKTDLYFKFWINLDFVWVSGNCKKCCLFKVQNLQSNASLTFTTVFKINCRSFESFPMAGSLLCSFSGFRFFRCLTLELVTDAQSTFTPLFSASFYSSSSSSGEQLISRRLCSWRPFHFPHPLPDFCAHIFVLLNQITISLPSNT